MIFQAEDEIYKGDLTPILTSIRQMNHNLSNTLTQVQQISEQVAEDPIRYLPEHRISLKRLQNRQVL